ncbi:MAG: hypothetical protein ACKPKO_50210 [Candidatus Fonsibacter sp.]
MGGDGQERPLEIRFMAVPAWLGDAVLLVRALLSGDPLTATACARLSLGVSSRFLLFITHRQQKLPDAGLPLTG